MILRALNRDWEPRGSSPVALDDVAKAIAMLDGVSRTLVTLEVDDDHHMGIGGGHEQYVVYMTVDNLSFKNLVRADAEGPLVTLMCGGQEGEYPARQCVDQATATRAAQTFAETGQPDVALKWDEA